MGMRILVPLAARRSHRIIVPSNRTKDDLSRLLRVEAAKIDVVPMGVATPAPHSDLADVRRRYELGDGPVVLTTSAKRPHKNLRRFWTPGANSGGAARVLVLPGYPTPHEQELRRHAGALGIAANRGSRAGFPPQTSRRFTNSPSASSPVPLRRLRLTCARGDGTGDPVACSGRASLAEVVDGAARLFDPESPQSIADAVDAILSSAELAARLREAGREQARRFTWSATARGTLGVYERAQTS